MKGLVLTTSYPRSPDDVAGVFVADAVEALRDAGALGARMSGSGPTVFGIFATEHSCRAAAERLKTRGWRLYPAEILTGPLYGDLQESAP